MPSDPKPIERRPPTPFAELGLKGVLAGLLEEIQELYCGDEVPWVVGYSGGKDSTAVLQLVWMAVAALPDERRRKPVHVISTDTLVENPVVARWVERSLQVMGEEAERQGLPVQPHRLTPRVQDSFWVNLIGKGYPAPRHKFRWCTERLKIKPSNEFIRNVVQESGEAILVLGSRKAESTKRRHYLSKIERSRIRERLAPNAKLPNSLVYTPIEDWSNDEVWLFLMQTPNPWGFPNKDLLTLYQGASPDAECPLVVDTTTPSCGDSRFGCWVCTLVEKDKSMEAMILNDQQKEWMLPLLELRNALDIADDRHLRDFRRMDGRVSLFGDRLIHGPYTQGARELWLRRLLQAERAVRDNGPDFATEISLISQDELDEIRRIWVFEKHEFEDSLPTIYEEETGQAFAGAATDDRQMLGYEDIHTLREVCDGDQVHFELVRELLDVEWRHRTMMRRSGLFEALEQALRRGFFADEEDALDYARRRGEVRGRVRDEESDAEFGAPGPVDDAEGAAEF